MGELRRPAARRSGSCLSSSSVTKTVRAVRTCMAVGLFACLCLGTRCCPSGHPQSDQGSRSPDVGEDRSAGVPDVTALAQLLAIEALLDRVESGEPYEVRHKHRHSESIDALVAIGNPAIPAIVKRATSGASPASSLLTEVLERIGSPTALEGLIRVLEARVNQDPLAAGSYARVFEARHLYPQIMPADAPPAMAPDASGASIARNWRQWYDRNKSCLLRLRTPWVLCILRPGMPAPSERASGPPDGDDSTGSDD